jgi:hypothetical protein
MGQLLPFCRRKVNGGSAVKLAVSIEVTEVALTSEQH